jgi:hypothetical protein
MNELDKNIQVVLKKLKEHRPVTRTGSCPDEKSLAYYSEGVLNENEKESLEQHLLSCNDCLNSIILYEKLKKESLEYVPEVPGAWNEKIMSMLPQKQFTEDIFDIVIRFAKEAIEIIRNPGDLFILQGAVPAVVRGAAGIASADSITLSRIFSNMKTEIEIERTQNENLTIKVLLTDKNINKPVSDIRVSIFDPDYEIASFIAENGQAVFTEMRFGKYIIKLTRRGQKIGKVSLDLTH